MPRNLSEADRKKNQFDKEERVHLLAIMKQYAPLLDKSASTLARKKIWTTIEDEFKKAGFTRKTSAQLKKYWQNYKYHCKKAMAFGKVFSSGFPFIHRIRVKTCPLWKSHRSTFQRGRRSAPILALTLSPSSVASRTFFSSWNSSDI